MTTATDITAIPEPQPTTAAVAAARAGAIVLARHGEPALSRRVKLNAEGYRRWWARYEEGGLLGDQAPPPTLVAAATRSDKVFASIRPRAIQTAKALRGDAALQIDEVFIEAPLPPPRFPSWLRMSPRAWGVVSRFWWWWFNHHADQESRRQAETRADSACQVLIREAEAGHDVMLVAHGFFNAMIGIQLKRRGWRCVCDGGYRYWSSRRFEKRLAS